MYMAKSETTRNSNYTLAVEAIFYLIIVPWVRKSISNSPTSKVSGENVRNFMMLLLSPLSYVHECNDLVSICIFLRLYQPRNQGNPATSLLANSLKLISGGSKGVQIHVAFTRSNFFLFHAVFGTNGHNNSLGLCPQL